MIQSFILRCRVQQEYNSLLVNALNRIFKSNLSLNKKSQMAAYKTGALVRSKYYTPFYKTPLKWIPRSKSGASKSRLRWAAHTRLGNVWEYPPPPPQGVGVALQATVETLYEK